MKAWRQFFAIWRLTVVELARDPLCVLLTATAMILTVLVPPIVSFQLGEETRMARDGALAFQLVFGLLLAGLAASSTLNRELREGTAAGIFCFGVPRGVFFLAKFAGVATMVGWFVWCLILSTVISIRTAPRYFETDFFTLNLFILALALAPLGAAGLNFFARRPFWSSVLLLLGALLPLPLVGAAFRPSGESWGLPLPLDWQTLPANLLVAEALLVLTALCMMLAARLDGLRTMAAAGVIVALGLMADYWLSGLQGHPIAHRLVSLLPNWQHFWMADALSGGGRVPWAYVLQAAGYAGLLSAGFLGIGAALFAAREV